VCTGGLGDEERASFFGLLSSLVAVLVMWIAVRDRRSGSSKGSGLKG
jgi:hypothetical protein